MFLLRNTYSDGVPGPHHLALEGALAAFIGTLFGLWLFPAEVSLVAVFLASITTADSIERVLEANRKAILEDDVPPARANLRLSLLMLAMFAGTVVGFSILVWLLPLETVETAFGHQLQDVHASSFPTLEFGHPVAIGVNNVYVLLFFFAIAMPFRQGGVMLAVAWNASVWGATFGLLARSWSESGGPGLIEAYIRVIGACFPHMTLEAFAYVLAGFAGVFLSKGLVKYSMDSPILMSITKTVGAMLGAGGLLVVIGAAWEGTVAGWLVELLGGT